MESLIFDSDKYKQTLSGGKRFLLVDVYEGDQRITIFCSDVQLEMLCKASKIGADGTFKSSPELYKQIHILTAWFMGMVIPGAFILLGGKKKTFF